MEDSSHFIGYFGKSKKFWRALREIPRKLWENSKISQRIKNIGDYLLNYQIYKFVHNFFILEKLMYKFLARHEKLKQVLVTRLEAKWMKTTLFPKTTTVFETTSLKTPWISFKLLKTKKKTWLNKWDHTNHVSKGNSKALFN